MNYKDSTDFLYWFHSRRYSWDYVQVRETDDQGNQREYSLLKLRRFGPQVSRQLPADAHCSEGFPLPHLMEMLQELDPKSDIPLRWKKHCGDFMVELHANALRRLPEVVPNGISMGPSSDTLMHVRLAFPLLHEGDKVNVWTTVETSLRKHALGKTVPLNHVASKLKEAVSQYFRNPEMAIERTDAQWAAVHMMRFATEISPLQDWMFGWLHYMFDEV